MVLVLLALVPGAYAATASSRQQQQASVRSPSLSLAQQRLLDLCVTNTRCALAFHLPPPSSPYSLRSDSLVPRQQQQQRPRQPAQLSAYDVKLFRHLLNLREAELGISSEMQPPFSCVAATEPPPDQDCLDWWLVVLQQAQFCAANEQWVAGVGCRCQEGKVCEAEAADEISWSYSSFLVMGAVLLAGVLFAGSYVVYRLLKLHRYVQTMQWVAAELAVEARAASALPPPPPPPLFHPASTYVSPSAAPPNNPAMPVVAQQLQARPGLMLL
jgi:hypothetical protein